MEVSRGARHACSNQGGRYRRRKRDGIPDRAGPRAGDHLMPPRRAAMHESEERGPTFGRHPVSKALRGLVRRGCGSTPHAADTSPPREPYSTRSRAPEPPGARLQWQEPPRANLRETEMNLKKAIGAFTIALIAATAALPSQAQNAPPGAPGGARPGMGPGAGQTQGGTIRGTVHDAAGAPVPAAQVSVWSAGGFVAGHGRRRRAPTAAFRVVGAAPGPLLRAGERARPPDGHRQPRRHHAAGHPTQTSARCGSRRARCSSRRSR
jgi:hypothetical protein